MPRGGYGGGPSRAEGAGRVANSVLGRGRTAGVAGIRIVYDFIPRTITCQHVSTRVNKYEWNLLDVHSPLSMTIHE